MNNQLKNQFIDIASSMNLDLSSIDWSVVDDELLSHLIMELGHSPLFISPSVNNVVNNDNYDNIVLSGYINETVDSNKTIYGITAKVEILRFYEKYKESLPLDFLEKYGYDYIVGLRYGQETASISKTKTDPKLIEWFYNTYIPACHNKEYAELEKKELIAWEDFHPVTHISNDGYLACTIGWNLKLREHNPQHAYIGIEWEHIQRKVEVLNERSVTLGLPSEHLSGFKSHVRLPLISGNIIGYTIINGTGFIKQRAIEEIIPGIAKFSKKNIIARIKENRKNKRNIKLRSPDKVIKSQVGRKTESDYKVKGAKFRIKWKTAPISDQKLFRGGIDSIEVLNGSHWKIYPFSKNKNKYTLFQIRLSKCGSQLWVHFSDSTQSQLIAKTKLLPNGLLTVVPIRTIAKTDTQRWYLFNEVLSYLGIREDRVKDTNKKIDRKVELKPPQPTFNYERERKTRKKELTKNKSVRRFSCQPIERRKNK